VQPLAHLQRQLVVLKRLAVMALLIVSRGQAVKFEN
jgi:hypothetical protein